MDESTYMYLRLRCVIPRILVYDAFNCATYMDIKHVKQCVRSIPWVPCDAQDWSTDNECVLMWILFLSIYADNWEKLHQPL